MVGDLIARGLYVDPDTLKEGVEIPKELQNRVAKPVPHFVVAVKHSRRMLYRLLFRRDILRIYASFPISDTRDKSKRVAEVNKFRTELESRYTVFDPCTIDELRGSTKKGAKKALKPRWPLGPIVPMVKQNKDRAGALRAELKKYEQPIKDQIEERDYRLGVK